ncbi:unnamed protein product [Prorocentrum cordatum]|uniref:Uncharacterized protein n=1 Tax=Prorocentrum cordatum TaxID=2364126 RepID=A0ABN9QI39_9DINO|nr:unnamed protein product [Polarella glacialis]
MSKPAPASRLRAAAASSGNANASAKHKRLPGAAALYRHQMTRTGLVRVASTPMRIRVTSSLIIPGRLRDIDDNTFNGFWAPLLLLHLAAKPTHLQSKSTRQELQSSIGAR